jgi:iron(III) transport system substrate-binding protein
VWRRRGTWLPGRADRAATNRLRSYRIGPRPGSSRSVKTGTLAVTLPALAAVTALALAGCSSAGGSGSATTTLTLYNGQHEQTTDALVTAFTRQTGIRVQVRNGDEDQLAQQIQTEGSASPADVIYTENSPPLVQLAEKSLLSQVDPSTLASVPAEYSSADHNWVGVSARVSTLVYNTKLLKPDQLPTSVMQLADPEWKGKLDIAPSETDLQPVITSIEIKYGQAAALNWLEGIKRNAGSHIEPDNETIVSNVNRGITAIALVNHYYWYRLRAEQGAAGMQSAVAYFAPHDVGYLVDISGAAVLKSSKNQAAAQRLLAFLVSKSGQDIIANSDSFEYPIAPGVAANPQLRPFATLQPNPLSLAALGDGRNAVSLLQEAGLL